MLADLLMALNENEKALQILSILCLSDQNPMVKSQFVMMRAAVEIKKPEAKSKQHSKLLKQIQVARNESRCVFKID